MCFKVEMLPQPAVWLELTRGQIPGGVNLALLPFRNQVITICAHGWFTGGESSRFQGKAQPWLHLVSCIASGMTSRSLNGDAAQRFAFGVAGMRSNLSADG